MSMLASGLVGLVATLAAGLFISGEDRMRRHAAFLSKAAHAAGLTAGVEDVERMIFDEKLYSTAQLVEMPTALAVGGVVYDVSVAAEIYGESGWYGYLRGRDATRVFATGKRVGYSFDTGLDDGQDPSDSSGLANDEYAHICYYVKLFASKYPKLGVVADGLYFKGPAPTHMREVLDEKCRTLKAASHMGDDEDTMFADIEDTRAYTTRSKCPVVKTTMVVKEAAKVVVDQMTKLIAY